MMPTLNDMLAQQYGMDATSSAAVNIGSMIGKVMEGQLGALSRYGYSWDEAQEKVLKHGNELERAAMLAEVIGQSVGGMNEQLARTPVGMMRQLAFTFGAIKEELGRGLMPVLQRVLPYLQAAAQWLLRITQYVSAFLQALFGSSQATNAISDQAGAVSDLGDAYEEAGKKARKSVGGFDQLNTVGSTSGSGDEDTSYGGINLGTVDTSSLDEVGSAMTAVQEKAQAMAAKVKGAYKSVSGFIKEHSDIIIAALAGVGVAMALAFGVAKWATIIEVLKKIGMGILAAFRVTPVGLLITAVAALVTGIVYLWRTNDDFRNAMTEAWGSITDAIKQFWDNVMVPFGAWLMDVMPIAWQAVKEAALDVWERALVPLGNFLQWVWDNVFIPFGAWLADVMPKAWDAVKVAAMWLWQNVLVPFGNFLKWLWKEVLVPIGKVIGEALAIAFSKVSEVAKSFWHDVLVPLGKALAEMFGPAVEAVSAVLTWLWLNVLKPLGAFIAATIMPIIEGLVAIFTWLWQNVLKPLVSFVGSVLVSVFTNAFKSIGGIIGGVKDVFVGLMKFITGVFTGDWKKAWEGVKQIFKGIFDTLWSIIKFPLNLIIDGINALIGGLNKISFDIPDWVPGSLGGKTFGVNIPKIPKLAVGTNYVADEGLAYLHEGEAVVPKKYNPAAGGAAPGQDNREVVSVLKLIHQAVKAGSNVQVNLSRTAIGQIAIGAIQDEHRRTGRLPFQA
ncbi:phage tail protein [Paenibacillus paeoniae]|uniref:phage tail protein n=1 Tax=Paenibacillus paeoniae TaxID=2292705 RepID=UPI001058C210|nr:hypothetical protein [Paenibacillus paeoniae]